MNMKSNPTTPEMDGSESRFNRVMYPHAAQLESPISEEITPNKGADPELPDSNPIVPDPAAGRKRKLPAWFVVMLCILIFLVFFTPSRLTLLVMGIDRPPKDTWIGRSDTMILTTLPPVLPQVSMLSIPRDLWVPLGGGYENRINTAHYFAELNESGSGMTAARAVVQSNFGIKVDYVLRLKFTGFVEVVDALGGVTVNLPQDMSGLTAGTHTLNGTEALKFVRDRKGSDDFFRQQRGQLFLAAMVREFLNPLKWPRLPPVAVTAAKSIETNLPVWLWPRFAYGFLFSSVKGFDSHIIDRDFLTSWLTDEGAQVLLPNWDLILPEVRRIFN